MLDAVMACAAIGSPETVENDIRAFINQHQPDELMLAGHIHDPRERMESFRIASQIMERINADG